MALSIHDPFTPFDETPMAERPWGSLLSVPDALLPSRPGVPGQRSVLPRWRIAARALDSRRWVSDVDAEWGPTLAMKRDLAGRRRDEVVAVADGSGSLGRACDEAARGVLESVGAGCRGAGLDALVEAALLVADDLCLLTAGADGTFGLSAAVLCAPNRWRLADKIGQPMSAVHAAVPRYAIEVGAAVDSMLSRLAPERPVWRTNWGVLDDAALFQPVVPAPMPGLSVAEMWLRVERQTLRRLPESGAVLFTIRTHLETLGHLAARRPAAVRELGELVAELPDDVASYKSLLARRDDVVGWCAQVV